ncbi:MAG TPA: hypothetical protein VGB02_02980 [Pyrinomonadaceae bacterium]|jgi:hypothetical protein
MFELRKKSHNDYFDIYIDGKSYNRVHAYYFKDNENGAKEYVSKEQEASQQLINYNLKDFSPFSYISLDDVFNWLDFEHSIWISHEYEHFKSENEMESKKTGNLTIGFNFSPNLLVWNKEYSFADYVENFEDVWNKEKKYDGKFKFYKEDGSPSFDITFLLPQKDCIVYDLILPFVEVLKICHQSAIKILVSSQKIDSLETSFNFPKEISDSCQQYLVYFARFLRDLGINATSNIKEEVGKVLFSVTPTDDIEALDKIREALAVYLNLPSSPIVYDDSFAAMRLQQQIENLQHSQKMAARELQLTEKLVIAQSEMIQEKNIIISQKDSVIKQQHKVIEKITSKSIMMDSLENKEELEEIYNGLSIGESKFLKEQLGIHFNPAKVIKTGVNNLFGKGDDIISILDSDEETEKNS